MDHREQQPQVAGDRRLRARAGAWILALDGEEVLCRPRRRRRSPRRRARDLRSSSRAGSRRRTALSDPLTHLPGAAPRVCSRAVVDRHREPAVLPGLAAATPGLSPLRIHFATGPLSHSLRTAIAVACPRTLRRRDNQMPRNGKFARIVPLPSRQPVRSRSRLAATAGAASAKSTGTTLVSGAGSTFVQPLVHAVDPGRRVGASASAQLQRRSAPRGGDRRDHQHAGRLRRERRPLAFTPDQCSVQGLRPDPWALAATSVIYNLARRQKLCTMAGPVLGADLHGQDHEVERPRRSRSSTRA